MTVVRDPFGAARASAAVSEGMCPACSSRLTPLTDEQRVLTSEWVYPPVGVCPGDHSDGGRFPGPFYVGPYTDRNGAYVSLRARTDEGCDTWLVPGGCGDFAAVERT